MELPLVGAQFRPVEARTVLAALQPGAEVFLIREPSNKYDPNAVQIHVDGHFIGFVAKGYASMIAQRMDEVLETNPERKFPATMSERLTAKDILIEFDYDALRV